MSIILAIDAGTTGVRTAVYDTDKNSLQTICQKELAQYYPATGYVEENPHEMYNAVLWTLNKAIGSVENIQDIKGLGITNQRETVILWDSDTFEPIYNAIVWQCRRTADYCREIAKSYGAEIKQRTGLIVDAYFSASKIRWILDNVPKAKQLLKEGRLMAGTVDTYLIYRLTKGKSFVTDVTNASRTMLFNINTMAWDEYLLDIFGIDKKILPTVVSCDEVAGYYNHNGYNIPICGIAGDQQAAFVGQCCFDEGESKVTYGTGMFMLFNAGGSVPFADKMLATVGYRIGGNTVYALEGSVFNAGSAVQWLRDNLNFFDNSAESEAFAVKAETNGGVYVVPAFTGLGAPHWEPDATGIIIGIKRSTNKYHITRAVLEAMAYSARELVEYMQPACGRELKILRCDGGASANDFLMQFQADILNVALERPVEKESTIMGAVYLCMLGLGIKSLKEIKKLRVAEKRFLPKMDKNNADLLYKGYKNAIKKCILH